MLFASLAFVLAACSGSGPQSALEPRGPIAEEIDGLWELVYILAVAVFVFVMVLLLWSIIRYRDRGQDAEPKQVHGNTAIELGGVMFSVVLLTVIGIPTVSTLLDIRDRAEQTAAVEVHVTGHQWWWEFEYKDITSDDGRWIKTANELHIPADTDVKLVMTSVDVIHSFWVPSLNGKRDVVPGRETLLTLHADGAALASSEAHEPSKLIRGDDVPEGLIAVIPGQCAEFCGLAHADMRVRVFVHDDAGFEQWAAAQLEPAAIPAGVDDSSPTGAALGYTVFDSLCTTCHQATIMAADGSIQETGAKIAPNLTHFGSRETFGGATFVNDAEHVGLWLTNPSAVKPMAPARNDLAANPPRVLGMPNFGLSADEIAGLQELLLEDWR